MGSYDLSWYTAGNTSVELLHYALAHHQVCLPACFSARGMHASAAGKLNDERVSRPLFSGCVPAECGIDRQLGLKIRRRGGGVGGSLLNHLGEHGLESTTLHC